MKVVLLAPTPPPAGGIASWTERYLKAELRDNWSIKLVDEKIIGKRPVFGKDEHKRNLLVEIKRCLTIWKKLSIAIKDEDVKVVHSCIPSKTLSMMREYICAIISRMHRKKFIIHFRCTVPNTTKGRIGKYILRKLATKSDLIICLNQITYDYLDTIVKTKKVIIPNFVSEEEIADQYNVNKKLSTILYVGGVIEEKGAYEMLHLASRFPDIIFRFVGNYSPEILKYINENNMTNVILTGTKNRDEVKHEMENADIFLFLTHYSGEGFSNALVEAMACGLPCLATDWAANKDMIEGRGGIIIAPGDIEAASEAINQMRDENVRKDMSSFNIEKVRTAYSEKVVINRYLDEYDRLAGNNT